MNREEQAAGGTANERRNRMIIVSNRLPVVIANDAHERWTVRGGSGGLVTALAPVLRHRGGTWVGWPGVPAEREAPVADLLERATTDAGYTLHAVPLSQQEVDDFYYGFSNEITWPLFHDLQSHCVFRPQYWQVYEEVNRRFAHAVLEHCAESDFIWIHDYHLMSVGKTLREAGSCSPSAFFLHIPFPPLDIFLKLPWRFEILRHLLEYDLVGFQTPRDKKNFVQCVRSLAKDVTVGRSRPLTALHTHNRRVLVGAFPISIDFDEFADAAASREVADTAWYVHEDLPNRKILLGVDRLDYTKGIPEKLEAFRAALRKYPDLHRKVSLIQIVVPSRHHIPRYARLKQEIERRVSEINGEFTRPGWVPIHYIYRHLDRRELLAYYRTAEIALITPLKDGMNLVAKEYCASNLEGNGVLILSEFAGAVAQLHRWALLVNPHDSEGIADAIHRAFTMTEEERRRRMLRLRRSVRRQNIYWWVDSFLAAAVRKRLRDYPFIEPYSYAQDILGQT